LFTKSLKKIFAFSLLALACACARGGADLNPGAKAPDFTLPSYGGAAVHMAALDGRVRLLCFWSVRCPACSSVVPMLSRLDKDFGPRGLSVLAVNIGDDAETVGEYVNKRRIGYTVVLDSEISAAGDYGVRGTPHLFLIDRKGAVKKQWLGYAPSMDGEVENSIQQLLQEK